MKLMKSLKKIKTNTLNVEQNQSDEQKVTIGFQMNKKRFLKKVTIHNKFSKQEKMNFILRNLRKSSYKINFVL